MQTVNRSHSLIMKMWMTNLMFQLYKTTVVIECKCAYYYLINLTYPILINQLLILIFSTRNSFYFTCVCVDSNVNNIPNVFIPYITAISVGNLEMPTDRRLLVGCLHFFDRETIADRYIY